jgi:hypothetical protein
VLDAVARYGFETYQRSKTALEQTADPVEDLRTGWDLHVDFGLARPAFYAQIYGEPRPGVEWTDAGKRPTSWPNRYGGSPRPAGFG